MIAVADNQAVITAFLGEHLDAAITDTREAQGKADLASAQEIAADIDLRNRRIVLGTLVGMALLRWAARRPAASHPIT